MKKETNSRFFYETKSMKMSGTANGCFCVTTKEKCKFYNAKGELQIALSENAVDGKLLNDNYYLLQQDRRQNHPQKACLSNHPVWSLFDNCGNLVDENIDECEVYANGWYRLQKDNRQQLYTSEHQLMETGFSECMVFANGYALRCNDPSYKYSNWNIRAQNGAHIYHAENTMAIVGNGLVLFHNGPEYCTLYDPFNDKTLAERIFDFQVFPNGRFIITVEEKEYHSTSVLYQPNGKRLGVRTRGATFLPDGRFITYEGSRAAALYRRNGFLETPNIWKSKIAGNYYFLEFEDGNILYDAEGNEVGREYMLTDWKENFTLVANKKGYHLFNQFGKVLTFPEE